MIIVTDRKVPCRAARPPPGGSSVGVVRCLLTCQSNPHPPAHPGPAIDSHVQISENTSFKFVFLTEN